jgi:ABC-type antimicrobial peptide transport system permease subunit
MAAAIGILNIFYMNMSERTREFGLLLSIGMTPKRIFYLVLIESFYITTLGVIAGGILIGIVYPIWAKFGLDLSAFESGLEYFGVSKYVYPYMDKFGIIFSLILIYFFGISASIYPAIKASRLSPAKAMRFVR